MGTPPRLYNQIVQVIAKNKSNTLAQNARLFALVNMAMADAGIQCWNSKYFYSVWRPVLGIREADPGWGPTGQGDGNSETEVDPFWLPLGSPRTNQPGAKNFTPNFPAYPSGHATFGAASLDMVRLFYSTDDIAFDFTSDELNGKSVDVDGSIRTKYQRHFARLSDAIVENARSRVYLGVHWQFDADAGVESGKTIAEFIFNNTLRPI
ncbi:MAG: vanadium-dependent haloperoxidase [Iphinoe sp. HA4291-MV1]|nr:vanadium-dependent haloperoxidase [Iphinoe sp. HA4291-MV1]